jgi:hypothetical protein
MSHHQNLSSLQHALADLQRGRMPVAAFCAAWRAQTSLLADLPPRYGQVLEDLLGRLEASSLFTEESCSFTHEDLHAGLTTWLQKAQQILAAPAA